jgi:L-lactate permease
MGQGISKTGAAFPLLSPLLGWIGVFMTGSVVNNNSLFAPIQASVAEQIGTKGSLLVDSLPTLLTAAVAIAIDCGDTILAVTPPATLAATSNDPFVPICSATEA